MMSVLSALSCSSSLPSLSVRNYCGVDSAPTQVGACALQITFLLVVNNAMQGVLSSFFFKYADTILKKYSSTVATLVTGLLSAALFGHQLTMNFCIGVTIVGISMHQFFSQGAAPGDHLETLEPTDCATEVLRLSLVFRNASSAER